MKTNAIFAIILGIALIIMSADKINSINKTAASDVTKIVWDILGVLFILGGLGAIWRGFKALKG